MAADESSPTRRFLNWRWAAATLITLLALALRIYHIDQESVGFDESFSLFVCRLPLSAMMDEIVREFTIPPLHFIMLRAWLRLFGFGVLQGRLLSAIFGTLAVPVVYFLASYLFGRRIALLSALLMAVSQVGIMYSQEARPYALTLLFFLSSCCLFIIAQRERRSLAWWGFICSSVLLAYTHYYGLLGIISLLLYIMAFRKLFSLPRSWLVGGAVLALALYAPWLASGVVQQALHSGKTHPKQATEWLAAHWWSFISTTNTLNNGRPAGLVADAPLWTFPVGALLFTVPVFFALKPLLKKSGASPPDRIERQNLVLLMTVWIVPILIALGLGLLLKFAYNVRYVAFCAAPYYVLAARGISQLSPTTLRRSLVLLLLAYSGYSLRANYFIPWRENYRDAVAYVTRNYQAGDCCLFLGYSGKIPNQWSVTQADAPALRVTSLDALAEPTKCRRVWAVFQGLGNPSVQMQGEAEKRSLATTHLRIEEKHFFGVDVELYSLKQ